MKKEVREIIIFVILAALALSAVSCAMLGEREDKDSESTEETTTSPAPETTDASIEVSANPNFYGSRDLGYRSNGDGSCTLTGIGGCRDSYLVLPAVNEKGENVTAIDPGAFAGCTTITAVSIPASISQIGDGAFSCCTALAYISVDPENKAYCSLGGMLYTADSKKLICLPAGTTQPSLTLTTELKEVVPSATEGCSGSIKVYYEGSASQWSRVLLGEKNELLTREKPVMMQTGK